MTSPVPVGLKFIEVIAEPTCKDAGAEGVVQVGPLPPAAALTIGKVTLVVVEPILSVAVSTTVVATIVVVEGVQEITPLIKLNTDEALFTF